MFFRYKVLALNSFIISDSAILLQSTTLGKKSVEDRFLEVSNIPNHCFTTSVFLVLDRLDVEAASKLEAIQWAHLHRVDSLPYLTKEFLWLFKIDEHRESFTIENLKDAHFNSLLMIHFSDSLSFHVVALLKQDDGYAFFDQNVSLNSKNKSEGNTLEYYPTVENLKRMLGLHLGQYSKEGSKVSLERVWYSDT